MEVWMENRLDPNTRLGPVELVVSDIERAMGFYGGVLGLSAVEQPDGTFALGVSAEPPLIFLREKASAIRKPRGTTGLYHYAILLPSRSDLARALQRLLAREYPLHGAADHLVSEAIYLADPDGNGIEIYRDRARDRWPMHEGRVQMATDPLDFDGLIAEADQDDDAWAGLPAGTAIGHVHLHVADLAAATAFYTTAVGMDMMAQLGTAAFLSAGGYHHHVGINTWEGVGAPPPPEAAVGLAWFTVRLPGQAALEQLEVRMRAFDADIETLEGRIQVKDPSGNGIRFVVDGNPVLP
jgi:catechol 2,3-dioxygenase